VKVNKTYIAIFVLLAIAISLPVHLGYLDSAYKTNTSGWLISNWTYLLAGFGPFIAAIFVLFIHKSVSNQISIFGDEPLKNLSVAFLPVIAFTSIGLENTYNLNTHYFAFLYSTINVIYAFLEEFGWRRYLQNALEGINKNWKYLIISGIWWVWHFRFNSQFDLLIFPLICIGGGFLLGVLADKAKSILPVTAMHSMIIIVTNSGSVTQNKLIGLGLTFAGWVILDKIWNRISPS